MVPDSSHRVIMGKRRHRIFSTVFDRIIFILAGNNDIHKSLDEVLPDSITELAALEHPRKIPKIYNGENDFITFSQIFIILAGNKDMHLNLDGFEFPQDPTSDYGVIYL